MKFRSYFFVSVFFVGLWLAPEFAWSQLIAKCGDLTGYSHYHYRSPVPKDKSGFQEDRISGGLTTLQKLGRGDYDILMVDARKQVISYKQDGGKILLLRRGKDDATFLVIFKGMVIELYTFYSDAGGEDRYDLLTSKGGDLMPIHKSSLSSGKCSELNLHLID